jgi:hypothetical protein
MRKQPKDAADFPRHEFQTRLSELLSAVSKAGLGDHIIAAALEAHAQSYRMRHVANSPVESCRVPQSTKTGGNGSLAQRLVLALKGEYERDGQ